METLKNQIQVLAEKQTWLKNQRKSKNISGERKLTPFEAFIQHQGNRIELRKMYMVYGILRGRKPEQMESNPKEPLDMKEINQIVESFKIISNHN